MADARISLPVLLHRNMTILNAVYKPPAGIQDMRLAHTLFGNQSAISGRLMRRAIFC